MTSEKPNDQTPTGAPLTKCIVGYGDRLSVAPGETIAFKVSCRGEGEFAARVVRLLSTDDHPDGTGWREHPVPSTADGRYPRQWQEIHAGSYAIVERSKAFDELRSFTLAARIWPTTARQGRQAVMGRTAPDGQGYVMTISDDGSLGLELCHGEHSLRLATGVPLHDQCWYLAVISFDERTGTARVVQVPIDTEQEAAAEALDTLGASFRWCCDAPFLIAGAWQGEGRPVERIFNGKISAPQIFPRALNGEEIETLRGSRTLPTGRVGGALAAWDFAREITSTRVVDCSDNALHGRLVNLPRRAVKGPFWDGSEMNWNHAPHQYDAIHFHDDDLYDAGWRDSVRFMVPDDLQSGVYALALEADGETDHIPFFVRPPRGQATAPLAFLVPTASYLAYANERGAFDIAGNEVMAGYLPVLSPEALFLNEHREYGYSLYDTHGDGSGVHYSSRLRPILNMRPKNLPWGGPGGSLPWQFSADMAIVDWLDRRHQAFDVITDEDLHKEGVALLRRYRTVVTGTHPEYYSTAMFDAVSDYLDQGGRLMYLGGNGFYWRIAFHAELPGVIEVRRAEDGVRDWQAEPGEYYHSFSGEYGGLWRRIGRPPQSLVGVGMAGQGFDRSTYYVRKTASRDPQVAFIFEGVEGEVIGDFGRVGNGAAGIEMDRADIGLGTPRHAWVLASSEDHSALTYPGPEEVDTVTGKLVAMLNEEVRADLTYFTTDNGGGVFSTGSIAWAGSLAHNDYENPVSRVTGNVLRRFLNSDPL